MIYLASEAALRDSFSRQGHACAALGSPFMGQLMRLCGERLARGNPVADKLFEWSGNPDITADNVSMRLAGGLHALVITGAAPSLVAAYPPRSVADDVLWAAVESAFETHADHLLHWLEGAPQTNEVRRSGALLPALNHVAALVRRPLALWEIGCSAGLNLQADQFHVSTPSESYGPSESPVRLAPEWQGGSPRPFPLEIVERRGVDLNPLDPTTREGRLRLRSYLWPDQPDRRTRTDAAIEVASASPAEIDRADAIDWLARMLPLRPPGVGCVLFHTVAWQYLPPEARARGDALIAAAGDEATPDAPLIRIGMEADGGSDAALTLTRWPGQEQPELLARVDFHGRRVSWVGQMAT